MRCAPLPRRSSFHAAGALGQGPRPTGRAPQRCRVRPVAGFGFSRPAITGGRAISEPLRRCSCVTESAGAGRGSAGAPG